MKPRRQWTLNIKPRAHRQDPLVKTRPVRLRPPAALAMPVLRAIEKEPLCARGHEGLCSGECGLVKSRRIRARLLRCSLAAFGANQFSALRPSASKSVSGTSELAGSFTSRRSGSGDRFEFGPADTYQRSAGRFVVPLRVGGERTSVVLCLADDCTRLVYHHHEVQGSYTSLSACPPSWNTPRQYGGCLPRAAPEQIPLPLSGGLYPHRPCDTPQIGMECIVL
jgi:hypothetical protein